MKVPQLVGNWIHQQAPPPLLLLSLRAEPLEELLVEITQQLVCTASTEPCGECSGCRQARDGSHPDVLTLDTAEDGSIKAIRTLLQGLTLRSTSATRLVILRNVEALSLPAAQALLKPLEEPAHNTRFILTTSSRQQVLPTIRSRSVAAYVPVADVPQVATAPWSANAFERLIEADPREPLSDEHLESITQGLTQYTRDTSPSPELKTAWQRLRDYHVTAARNGNLRAARDALLVALPDPKV